MTPIAPHITAFFEHRLPFERRASEHTRDSYAYAFKLFLTYASTRLKVAPSHLAVEQLDAPLVLDFLQHLETTRGNGASSRNIRLAAIKSFLHFLEYRVPSALEPIRRILAIPFKKTESRLVRHLSVDELQAILDAPDPTTWAGTRDRALLHLCYAGGLRVSELIGLRLDDVTFQPQASVLVRGKECHAYCTSFRRRDETTGTHAGRQACDLAFFAADVRLVVRRGIEIGPCTDAHGAGRVAPISEPWAA